MNAKLSKILLKKKPLYSTIFFGTGILRIQIFQRFGGFQNGILYLADFCRYLVVILRNC